MTAKFPGRKYPELDDFIADYASATAAGLHSVEPAEIDRAVTVLKRAIQDDRLIFACGNGGSAAIANDVDNAEIFTHQLRNAAPSGDVLITISASGVSENIVRALAWAADNGVTKIVLSGFSGGRSAAMADVSLHVAAGNCGIVEDVRQTPVHILAQYVRMSELPAELVHTLRF